MTRFVRSRSVQRASLALVLGCAIAFAVTLFYSARTNARATDRLNSAAIRLDALAGGAPEDDQRRAAIAWGYAERLRLGLESPFRLIDAAGRDPRLTADERRIVSWALLAHTVRGETHRIDAAALDGMGPMRGGRSASGEQHLALIDSAIARADNPRAAELAVRLAYTLAAAERLVDGSAPFLTAEAAAMMADREIARREASTLVRSARGADPVELVRRRRARRAFYVERPALMTPTAEIERDAIATSVLLLDALRTMDALATPAADSTDALDRSAFALAPRLYAAGARVPPSAPLAVTVQRYRRLVDAQAPGIDQDALERTRNAEMLVAVTRIGDASRQQRRAVGRLLLAAGVAMRSVSQEPVWFPTDTSMLAPELVRSLGLSGITFDADVPLAWRPYYLHLLNDGVRDLRGVLTGLRLDKLHVRFRMSAPADSALAMHDPRSRTLHLPVITAGGTLTHELAHELDRQSAVEQGHSGYQSDVASRDGGSVRSSGSPGRLAASLRALTEELAEAPATPSPKTERPAEIFATRVDWFVAHAMARKGMSSGFLSAAQDELLTGHVVHPERLRGSGRSRSLLTALEEMTTVAPFAQQDEEPSVQALLRWSLSGPLDRRAASEILRGERSAWTPASLGDATSCEAGVPARVSVVRMAAESRARGWLLSRARWTPDTARAPWARAILRQGPWSDALVDRRVGALRDYILAQLSTNVELAAGLSAYAQPMARRARCGGQ